MAKLAALDEECPDFANDSCIPVMVLDDRGGMIFKIKDLGVENHEPGGHTIWIKVEES
jgi:hypothetical protein